MCYLSLFRLRVWGHCIFEPLSSLAVPAAQHRRGPLIQATGAKDLPSFAPVVLFIREIRSKVSVRLEKIHFDFSRWCSKTSKNRDFFV